MRELRWKTTVAGAMALAMSLGPPLAAGEERTKSEEEQEKPRFRQTLEVTAISPDLPSESAYGREEIERGGISDLADFLRLQAGLGAARRGAINLDPQVRGLQESQVGVVVDGTRTFAAGPGRMDSDLSHVSLHAAERVEVVKGPYALAWGAGTLAAIRVTTFRPAFGAGESRVDGRAGARYAENGSATDAWAGIWDAGDRWRYQGLFNLRQGSDYEAGGGEEIPGDYESAEGRMGFAVSLDDSSVVEFLGGYQAQDDLDYPGRLLDATYFRTRNYSLSGSWAAPARRIDGLFAQLYSNRKDHRMNNDEKPTARPAPGRIPPFGLDVDLPTESNTDGGRLALSGGNDRWRYQAGGDLYRLDQTATRTVGRRGTTVVIFEDTVWPDASTEDLGVYLQLTRMLDRAQLEMTVRGDFVDTEAGEVSDFFRANTVGDLSRGDSHLSFAVSGRRQLGDAWGLSAGFGQAVRPPSVLEQLYSDRFPSTKFQVAAEFLGNPALEPEVSRQLDLEARRATAALDLALSLFYREIDDYITVAPDPSLPRRLPLSPPAVYRYVNGEAEMYGAELTVRGRAGDWVAWRAVGSWLRGEDVSLDEPMFGVAAPSATVGARVAPPRGRWWVDLETMAVDAQDRVATRRLEQPTAGYAVVHVEGGFELAGDWRLRAGVRNAGDKLYAEHLNSLNPFTRSRIPEIGRSVFVAVEWR